MSHTPGPWRRSQRIHVSQKSRILDGYGNEIAIIQPVAKFGIEGDTGANTNLIMAAPTMLDALKRAQDAVKQLCRFLDEANECWVILREIEAAIKLAEGK